MKKISEAKDYKVHNILIILHSSLQIFDIKKHPAELEEEIDRDIDRLHKESKKLARKMAKMGLTNKILELITKYKEQDFVLPTSSNFISISDKDDFFRSWNYVKGYNKIDFIHDLLKELYWDIQDEMYSKVDYKEDYKYLDREKDDSDYCNDNSSVDEIRDFRSKEKKVRRTLLVNHSLYYLNHKEFMMINGRWIFNIDSVLKLSFTKRYPRYKIDRALPKLNIKEESSEEDSDETEHHSTHDVYAEIYGNANSNSEEEFYSDDEEDDTISEESETLSEEINNNEVTVGELTANIVSTSVLEDFDNINYFVPTLVYRKEVSIEKINKLEDDALEEFVKSCNENRNLVNYRPINTDFLNRLNEKAKEKFNEYENKLQKSKFLSFKNSDVNIDVDLYKDYLQAYISENFKIKSSVGCFVRLVTVNPTIKMATLEIVNQKINSPDCVKKCLQLLQKLIPSATFDIERDIDLIQTLLNLYSTHMEAISILSKINLRNLDLKDLAKISDMSLPAKFKYDYKKLCEKHIKNREIEFVALLLGNEKKRFDWIKKIINIYHERIKEKYKLNDNNFVDLKFFNKFKSLEKITPEIYYQLEILLEKVELNYSFLDIFLMYEQFIRYLGFLDTENRDEVIDRYIFKRDELRKTMQKNPTQANKLARSDPELLKFFSKYNVLDYPNKKLFLENQITNTRYDVFYLSIRRAFLLQDSFKKVMRESGKEFSKKSLEIKFAKEKGEDYGGLTKEWLELVVKEVTNPTLGIFKYSSDSQTTIYPSSVNTVGKDYLSYFRFFGRILGRIILERYNVGFNLAKSVFKYILGKKCDLSDLQDLDPEYYKSLIWIKENTIENVLFLTFSTETEDLIPNGKNIQVTDQNKEEYINLVVEHKLVKSVEQQLKSIRLGFYEMIDEHLISIFNEQELEILICGSPEINVEDWEANTEYEGYTRLSQNIIWFWKVVHGMKFEEKAKLLQFCTGSSRVPYEGFSNLQGRSGIQKFKISRINTVRLPTAHTCFNSLDLPEYLTYEELRKNLIYAINECQGGFELV